MRIIQTDTDYEIWDNGVFFSCCEKENTEYIEKFAATLGIQIEYCDSEENDEDF